MIDWHEEMKKLRLIDDMFFCAFFDNNPEDAEYILQIILDKPDLKVLELYMQKDVENILGHSVRFDVLAIDTEGKLYNIEVQRSDEGAIAQRARYNSAMLDFHTLQKGAKYNELPETFVIFITEHDVLKGNLPIYHIERIIRENNSAFGDGTKIIYVNGSYKDNSGSLLGDLVHDFFVKEPEEMKLGKLAKRMKYVKKSEFGGIIMSELSEKIFAEGKAEGRAEGRAEGKAEGRAEGKAEGKANNLLENIRSLMTNLKFTAKQAMDALGVPVEEQNKIANLI